MPVKPVPEGFHTVTPYLVVDDVPALIAFLREAFDAEELSRTTLDGGRVMHAQVRIGDSNVMMGEATEGSPALNAALYLYVPNVDASHARAVAAGGESVMEPADQLYGDRTAGVRGPGGVSWWLGTHVEDVSPEEIASRARELER